MPKLRDWLPRLYYTCGILAFVGTVGAWTIALPARTLGQANAYTDRRIEERMQPVNELKTEITALRGSLGDLREQMARLTGELARER